MKFKYTFFDDLSVKSDIGQGTILGPLIFIFYIRSNTFDLEISRLTCMLMTVFYLLLVITGI